MQLFMNVCTFTRKLVVYWSAAMTKNENYNNTNKMKDWWPVKYEQLISDMVTACARVYTTVKKSGNTTNGRVDHFIL